MTQVEGLGTRFNFPDYIARRPVMAMAACTRLGEYLQHCADQDIEIPFKIPPFSVCMYIEMIGVLQELTPEGVVFRLQVPDEVREWLI